MNSMRFIQMAIEYEARRQIAIVEAGGEVVQETRLYDAEKNETRSMRSKEEAHDYRYFPDPDLLPLEIEQAWVDGIAANLPELPDEKKARFVLEFGLSEYDASVLTADLANAAYFEQVAAGAGDGKLAANWVINELFGRLKKEDHSIEDSPVNPATRRHRAPHQVRRHLRQDRQGPLRDRLYRGRRPRRDRRGARHETGDRHLRHRERRGRSSPPTPRRWKRQANPKLAGWFVGQVMKATGGKANPKAGS